MPCFDAWGKCLLYPLKAGAMFTHYPSFQLLQAEDGNKVLCLFPTHFRRVNALGQI